MTNMPCRHFQKGFCERGEQCIYTHELELVGRPIEQNPDSVAAAAGLSLFSYPGSPNFGDICGLKRPVASMWEIGQLAAMGAAMALGADDLPDLNPKKQRICFKTATCRHFDRGFCSLGVACNFAHGDGELGEETMVHDFTGYTGDLAKNKALAPGALMEEASGWPELCGDSQAQAPAPAPATLSFSTAAMMAMKPAPLLKAVINPVKLPAIQASINLAAAQSGMPPQRRYKKTQMCHNFTSPKGCNKGEVCTYAHGEDQLGTFQPTKDDIEGWRFKQELEAIQAGTLPQHLLQQDPETLAELNQLRDAMEELKQPPSIEPQAQLIDYDAMAREQSEAAQTAATIDYDEMAREQTEAANMQQQLTRPVLRVSKAVTKMWLNELPQEAVTASTSSSWNAAQDAAPQVGKISLAQPAWGGLDGPSWVPANAELAAPAEPERRGGSLGISLSDLQKVTNVPPHEALLMPRINFLDPRKPEAKQGQQWREQRWQASQKWQEEPVVPWKEKVIVKTVAKLTEDDAQASGCHFGCLARGLSRCFCKPNNDGDAAASAASGANVGGAEAAGVSVGSDRASNSTKSIRMCHDFLAGRCGNGDACDFAHGEAELKAMRQFMSRGGSSA